MNLKEQLMRDEGLKLRAYRDSVGKWTIGIGHNLEDRSISMSAAQLIFEDDVAAIKGELQKYLPWTDALDEARAGVLLNMAFNLGIGGLLEFRNMLAALQAGNFENAAAEMLKSKWAKQVGQRAQRLSVQMVTGEWQ